MDQHTLERLVMDRQLGELSADGTALLDAYLREHPRDASDCDEFLRALGNAQRATRPHHGQTSLRTLDAPRMRRALRLGDAKATVARWRPVAIAAAIALAFFLGSATRLQTGNSARPSFARLEHAAPSNPPDTGDFWSINRYTTVSPPKANPTVIWTSPLTKPQLGETL